MSVNYESELSDLFIDKLQQLYGVQREDIAYRIFILRFYLENVEMYKKQRKNSWELERKLPYFLIDELNLPIIDGELKYKGEVICFYRNSENSLTNIMDDWFFRYADTLTYNLKGENVFRITLVKKELENIIREAEKLTKIRKRDSLYHCYFMNNCLKLLNHAYGIVPADIGRIENFQYPINHNDFKTTLEEKYARLIHADKMKKGTLNYLSEDTLEHYLIRNLNCIEEGLKLIQSQYVIDNGRIDIFAKDKNDNYCIIELKVEDDERLIWQSMYYPMAIKDKFKTNKIRMIVVSPGLSEYIMKPLRQLNNIEVFKFTVKMSNKKITNLKISKIL